MTAPYLPERPYQYPGPPRTPAEWAQQALAAKDAEIAALREFLVNEGYHAPGGCRDAGHDMNYWRGDHCARECRALAPPAGP